MRSQGVNRVRGYGNPLGILLFLLPAVGVYTALMLYPSLLSLYYSVLEWEGGPISAAPYVGLANFRQMLADPIVLRALLNNARRLSLDWGFMLPLALMLAFVLNRLRHGASLYRFLFYIPVILPATTMALLWRFVLSGNDYGVLNSLLRLIGREAWVRPWLSGDGYVQWTTSFPASWQHVGFYMVIFVAALVGIPEEYYEAAAIDGANGWRQLLHITLPNIRGVYVSCMVLTLQGALGAFIYPLLMTKGGPIHLSETLISYSLYLLWEKKTWGYGSAVATLSFLLGIIAVTLVWRYGRQQESTLYE